MILYSAYPSYDHSRSPAAPPASLTAQCGCSSNCSISFCRLIHIVWTPSVSASKSLNVPRLLQIKADLQQSLQHRYQRVKINPVKFYRCVTAVQVTIATAPMPDDSDPTLCYMNTANLLFKLSSVSSENQNQQLNCPQARFRVVRGQQAPAVKKPGSHLKPT